MPKFPRLARTVALAVIIGVGIFNLYVALTGWTLSDASAYWEAGLRIRAGEALYPVLTSPEGSEIYRYAPWFAWLAAPWTYLPQWLAGTFWSLILLLASAASLWPLIERRAWLLVGLFGPILIGISAVGNVQPLIVAGLMLGLDRRSGPIWVALAASLKIFPILFAIVWLGRRQFGKASVALVLTVVLWAPAPLMYDLSSYPTDPGLAGSLFSMPTLWFIVVGLLMGTTLALAKTTYGWLAAGTAVAVALPRLFVYDVSFVLPGILGRAPRSRGRTPWIESTTEPSTVVP